MHVAPGNLAVEGARISQNSRTHRVPLGAGLHAIGTGSRRGLAQDLFQNDTVPRLSPNLRCAIPNARSDVAKLRRASAFGIIMPRRAHSPTTRLLPIRSSPLCASRQGTRMGNESSIPSL
jgi:hypothetical protein